MNWLARRNPTSRVLGKLHPDTAESFKFRDTAMRFFNTAGPVDCERHYCLPPLERLNLNYVLQLIDQQKYFVLHAPWQTGKTSVQPGTSNPTGG